MNILAFDTCFGACSVAVGRISPDGRGDVTSALERCTTGHAEALFAMIERVLLTAHLDIQDVDRIATTIGPGSFTGSRISVAAARALHLATGAGLVSCSSLALIAQKFARDAEGSDAPTDLLVAMDARRGEAYVQLFDVSTGEVKTGPALMRIDDAAFLGGPDALNVAGTAAKALADAAARCGRTVVVLATDVTPDAAFLPRLAAKMQLDAQPPRPLYLRPPDARPQSGAGSLRMT